jgi:hypothetical protein
MARRAAKLNFTMEEDVKRDLELLIPSGLRSKVVNEALRKELDLIRRKGAVDKLAQRSSSAKTYSTEAIVRALKRDRDGH